MTSSKIVNAPLSRNHVFYLLRGEALLHCREENIWPRDQALGSETQTKSLMNIGLVPGIFIYIQLVHSFTGIGL